MFFQYFWTELDVIIINKEIIAIGIFINIISSMALKPINILWIRTGSKNRV